MQLSNSHKEKIELENVVKDFNILNNQLVTQAHSYISMNTQLTKQVETLQI